MKYVVWFFECTLAFLYSVLWIGPLYAFRSYSKQLWMGPDYFDEAVRVARESVAKQRFINQRKARGRGRR